MKSKAREAYEAAQEEFRNASDARIALLKKVLRDAGFEMELAPQGSGSSPWGNEPPKRVRIWVDL